MLVAAAGAAVLAVRRGMRRLDDADAELAPLDVSFPPGQVIEVAVSDGATIVTETTGSGPVVVLVHGITSSRQDLGPIARLLVDRGHTVIGVDQRGHGDSSEGPDGCDPERLAGDLAEILIALDRRDVTMVGHSMGGVAVMTFALEHPEVAAERVSALVLLATTPKAPRGYQTPSVALVERAFGRAAPDFVPLRPAAASALFGRFGSASLLEAARASGLRARPTGIVACASGLAGYDLIDRLPEITTPTRCVFGSRDVVTSARLNRLIARSIPNATSREIPGAGHLLIWTHAAEVADVITGEPGLRPTPG